MPELDGTQIVAIASFAILLVAWLFAPTTSAAGLARELPAAA